MSGYIGQLIERERHPPGVAELPLHKQGFRVPGLCALVVPTVSRHLTEVVQAGGQRGRVSGLAVQRQTAPVVGRRFHVVAPRLGDATETVEPSRDARCVTRLSTEPEAYVKRRLRGLPASP